MASEDFEKFVKENREEILRILEEDSDEEYTPSGEPSRFRETAEEVKQSFTKMTTEILKVMADEDVQKHFFNGITEFVKCMEAAVKVMPLDDDMKEAVEQVEKTRDTTMKNAAKAGVKATTLSKLEKVNITARMKKSDQKDD